MARRVYSTGVGRTCPRCDAPIGACRCRERDRTAPPPGGGVPRVSLEKKGRRGKSVTVVTGLPLAAVELAAVAKELKARCGTGGTVKDRAIELQGDRVAAVRAFLEEKGHL